LFKFFIISQLTLIISSSLHSIFTTYQFSFRLSFPHRPPTLLEAKLSKRGHSRANGNPGIIIILDPQSEALHPVRKYFL